MARRPCPGPVRSALGVHLLGSAIYWWLQPRGFAFGSPSWFEHEVIAATMFGASIAAVVGLHRHARLTLVASGLIGGFWIAVAGAATVVGAVTMTGVLAVAVALLVLAGRWARKACEPVRLEVAGIGAGLFVGSAFLVCAWAPRATTLPAGGLLDVAAAARATPPPDIAVSGGAVTVKAGDTPFAIVPALDFDAVSDSGFWTLFGQGEIHLPPWSLQAAEGGGVLLEARAGPLESRAHVALEGGSRVRVRCIASLDRDVAAHLASGPRVAVPGDVRVEGVPWRPGEFIAFRGGRMELLRPARDEKGPFTTLAAWEPHDPVIETAGWRIEVLGWAAQTSRAESPTAGWGVSQGAIENLGGELVWELAATSIGRGWHAVRTARGTYAFEVVIEPAR